jgi:O-antigen/teichoic acid export membrane protein
MIRSVLSNAFFSLVADVASRFSSALLLILVARKLGESAAGTFTLGNNYVLILSAIALWGLDQLLIRDVAHNRNLSSQYFRHFVAIRLVLAPMLWAVLAALLFLLRPYSQQTNLFVVLLGGTLIGSSVSNVGQALLIAFERVWLSALVSIIVSILLIASSVIAIVLDAAMPVLALILVLASWIQAAIFTWVVRRQLELKGFLDIRFCWRQLGAGFPFVPISLFMALETQLGSILLSLFHSEAVVGFYGMANVIITALALLSQALRVGLFPVMARLYRTEQDHFVSLYKRAWRYLAIVSLPLLILLILFSDVVIRLVYRQAAPQAVLTLRWLAPTLFFYFLNIPNVRLLILDGRQGALARLYAISIGANVLVGLLLIPSYGAPGVAVARVVSMSALFVLNCVYVDRHVLPTRPWKLLWQSLVASGIMALAVFVVLAGWPDYVRGFAGLALYGLLLVALKAIPVEEWLWLRQRLSAWVAPLQR